MLNSSGCLYEAIDRHLIENSELISKIEHNGQTIWIKRRPFSKQTVWHKLQKLLKFILPLPIFYPTASIGGPESIKHEAARLRLFAQYQIPVPNVLGETPDYLATSDVGVQLQAYFQQLNNSEEKDNLLFKAAKALHQLHQAGLCHGRPLLRDMTYQHDEVFFIDLEEDPLAVMSLAQAQARDVWLFMSGLVRQRIEFSKLILIFEVYNQEIPPETLAALKQMVKILKPLRIVAGYLGSFAGKDVRFAVQANQILEKILF